MKGKKILIISFLCSIFLISGIVLLGNNLNNDTYVHATDNMVSVNDGNSTIEYNINDVPFRNLLASNGNLIVTLKGDCELTSTLEVRATTTLLTEGNYNITRDGDFVSLQNYANLTIGDANSNYVITFERAEGQTKSVIENLADLNTKVLRINNAVLVGNDSINSAVPIDSPYESAFYNTGNAVVENIEISNFVAKMGGGIKNEGTMLIYAGHIHDNMAVFGGGIANVGNSADMVIGKSDAEMDLSNLRVLITDNSAMTSSDSLSDWLACGGGIYNGNVGESSKLSIRDCEFNGNTCHGYGGAIGNQALLTINYCKIIAQSAVHGGHYQWQPNAIAICNNGDRTYSATCDIHDCDIIWPGILIPKSTELVVNYGVMNIYGGNFIDLCVGKTNGGAGDDYGLLNINVSSKKISIQNLIYNLSSVVLKNVTNTSNFEISNLVIADDVIPNTNIFTLQNCSNSVVENILSGACDNRGFVISGSNVVLKYLVSFETEISGNAVVGETLSAEIINIKRNGVDSALDDVLNTAQGDTIEYSWYYLTDTNTKEVVATTKDFVIDNGVAGKKLYAGAKIVKNGYISRCSSEASTNNISSKNLVANWGSNAENWDRLRKSFAYKKGVQYPTILSFSTYIDDADLVLDAIVYEVFDSNGDVVTNKQDVGDYTVIATLNYDNLEIQNYEFEFSIKKMVVSIPRIKSYDLMFNFMMQSLDYGELDSAIVEVVGDSASKAGDYEVTFSLRDTRNFIWSNGSSDDLKYSWKISWIVPPVYIIIFASIFVAGICVMSIIKIKNRKKDETARSSINIDAIKKFNKGK